MSECVECGNKIGFFGGFKAAVCEGCQDVYCGKCKGKLNACEDCRGYYCGKCLSKDNHECAEEESGEESEEESKDTESEESADDDSGDEEEPVKVDMKEAEENETIVFSEDRNWVYFDRSAPDTWEEVFQILDKLREQGYEHFSGQEDTFIFYKKQ